MLEVILGGAAFLLQGIGYFFVGILVLIVLAVIFGDRKLWEYEVQGHCDACENGKLEIELKHLKNKGVTLEIEGKFKPEYLNKEILILLNGYDLASFGAEVNDGSRYQLEKAIRIEEPSVGDTISVLIDREELFSQKLYAD
jgi:hypothetical protein